MNTVNKKEIEKFSRIANEWWDIEGKFKPLHKFNPSRIKYIKNKVITHYNINSKHQPLKNIELLDIGCGGGLLSEPMCRLGAKVTAIDASQKNIDVAKYHSKKNNLKINYLCTSPEKIFLKKKFDVILNMEIVEHVDDLNLFLKKSSLLLKKNGLMFVATLNRTLKSYLFAIIGAEYFLRWLPIGTHDWNKFVEPKKLEEIGKNNSLKLKNLDGFSFNILKNEWELSNDISVNYITLFQKKN